jgi:hypothetical protein
MKLTAVFEPAKEAGYTCFVEEIPRCSGQASPNDDNFAMNFRGDINTWAKSIEEVKTAKLCQNNKRR